MNREDFVRGYALRSGLSDQWASLGIIDVREGRTLFALPCGCGDESCEGWAMVSAEGALDHLALSTPEPLREAYNAACRDAQKTKL